MAVHKYTSWGRTRRPKNIAGADGESVTLVASLSDAKGITDAVSTAHKAKPASGVYSTENQRYLHLSSYTNGTVTNVWVYHYATGKWSELTLGGNSITLAATKCRIVEIAGADLIALAGTNASDVHAACSTF